MTAVLLVSNLLLWALALLVGFLLLGALRAQGLLEWRLEQLEATMPSRIGRSGLAPGRRAPDFTLPCIGGGDVALSSFAGQKVLLVFVQAGCGPCQEIVPELNKLAARERNLQILAVNHAAPQAASVWAMETKAHFPILVQEDWSVSKKYEVFATPFAFLIDERGMITSKGIAGRREYLEYVLSGAGNRTGHEEVQGSTGDLTKIEMRQREITIGSA
jgi:methylamine dehydrogenase accessory protein MauD